MNCIRLRPAAQAGMILFLAFCLGGIAVPASAQGNAAAAQAAVDFNIPAQNLDDALTTFAQQSGQELLYSPATAAGITGNAVEGSMTRTEAMAELLEGTGLEYELHPSGSMLIGDQAALQTYRQQLNSSTTAGQNTIGQRRPGIEEIIVTGQKREERIQDVPIAISAFSAEDLEAQKLEGGFDLLKAIPNVTFTKTNFTGYNFQIRGIGTQATSATTDPGVAVSFNNIGVIQNRLFEQEYLDIERVEVLRGPQGTLYGRNATAGVINVITNKPEMGVWDGMLDVEVGNYNTRRLRGMFNMPIGDTLALRGAYASTDREGYTFNAGTGNRIDGRDLWTGRLTLGWQPNDRLRADLIYERFEEDDDRLRTGKQLCHRDDGPEEVGGVALNDNAFAGPSSGVQDLDAARRIRRAVFSQGCKAGSLYADEAFGTPNGLSYNFIQGLYFTLNLGGTLGFDLNNVSGDDRRQIIQSGADPYGGLRQSRDLREIESIRDPNYRAESDLFELNIDFDVTDTLQFSSQTAYVEDETFSFQDYNRFNTVPIFTDTTPLAAFNGEAGSSAWADFAPGGVYCDPQIGCSDKVAGFDIAQASAEQFTQEIRLQSSFSGPLNFSVGANYTDFETLVDYYVMFNLLSAMASSPIFNGLGGVRPPEGICRNGYAWDVSVVQIAADDPFAHCPYVDPNPVNPEENFEGNGHNYFRSKNPYELESWAGFGELYWNIRDDLKLTAGLRYTDDTKTFTQVPSQVLLASGFLGGGTVAKGYPVAGTVEQQWGEWTGRLVLDWQPVLDFTDETLIYASFSRGYKGGGANPPQPGFADLEYLQEFLVEGGLIPGGQAEFDQLAAFGVLPVLELTAVEYGDTFEPEFVNAYEIGTKNTLFGGAVMLNLTGFYYDYTDYQVSQIRDRTAVNENFDAEIWGLELETVYAPTPNWQFLANVGYMNTEIAEGETSIDIMNRTQGNPDYTLAKPWAQLPSNCVVPTHVAAAWAQKYPNNQWYSMMCGGVGGAIGLFEVFQNEFVPDTEFGGAPYDHTNYPELNGGAGLRADLSGNELPNSPRLTANFGGQYSFDLTRDWRATTRLDYYWQDESYHRIYNTEPYDRLKSWSNTNLSFWVNNANSGITVEAYVKNVFNETPITGAFLNSDDTGLTTNVFMFDPRLIGVSVRKEF